MSDFRLPPITIQQTINPLEIPWGVKRINAERAWEKSQGEKIVVAILDTGVDKNHSDLLGRVLDGKNFTSDFNADPNNYHDNQGHGTHCAGVVAGILDGNGIAGVAPKADLIIGKVLDSNGAGDYGDIIDGIKWATNWVGPNGEQTRIISMSLGGPSDVPALYKAIKAAVSKGISVVCASGNNGDNNHDTHEYAFPGAYQDVIEVGATDTNDEIAIFSNTNDRIDVVAPGVDIVSTMPNGKYAKMSGTSMATPHVAGALALLIASYETPERKLTEPEVFELLLKHVRALPHSKNAVGHGIVDFAVAEMPVDEPIVDEPATEKTPQNEFSAKIVERDNSFYIEVGPFNTKELAENKLTENIVKTK